MSNFFGNLVIQLYGMALLKVTHNFQNVKILALDYYFFQFYLTRDMAHVLSKFNYTKLFWYDGEQGNNRWLCLSRIFNVILWMGGVFLPHT